MIRTEPPISSLPISILGAGAWGTALAISLAKHHPVLLWGRNQETINSIQKIDQNLRYLPGTHLPKHLSLTSNFKEAISHVGEDGILIIATPVAGLRPILEELTPYKINHLIWLCKGFEAHTGLLPHQVVRETLGDFVLAGTLSGPSFAHEVAQGLPCALTIATKSNDLRDKITTTLHGGNIRIYSSEDVIGVEVGGAIKNILAIATGISDGLGLGLNARAALMTRGLMEMTRLGIALGADAKTFTGMSGVGDMILTCTGDLSRNRQVGLGIAAGKTFDHIAKELGKVAEGVRCVRVVTTLAKERGVSMPIADAVARVLFEGENARHAVELLLSRDPKEEYETE